MDHLPEFSASKSFFSPAKVDVRVDFNAEARRSAKRQADEAETDGCVALCYNQKTSLNLVISACHLCAADLKSFRSDKNDMIELVQFPWSPFCIVQRRILEFSGSPFKIVNIPPQDRSLVWKLTRQRYYGVPVLMDGKTDVFEVHDDSQVIGKYLDSKLGLGLFPANLEGVQSILWHHIENEVEGATFRLNDIHYKKFVPAADQLQYLRFKERKFGRGCIDQWRAQQKDWRKKLETSLMPFEEMLMYNSFLLGEKPRFVDFDLFGMLGNFLFSGQYKLPACHKEIRKWHARMTTLKFHNRS
jgi:glutathione S-transferase